ncbi:unnamed protein product, partial [Heterotrigona itama]
KSSILLNTEFHDERNQIEKSPKASDLTKFEDLEIVNPLFEALADRDSKPAKTRSEPVNARTTSEIACAKKVQNKIFPFRDLFSKKLNFKPFICGMLHFIPNEV